MRISQPQPDWKQKEKETISFLVKEFEAKKAAETYSRISVSKTGVIDTNKLHSYKYNDDIFRRLATIPKGKNHGFVMFIDWSGSMHYNLLETLKQTFSLALFCKQIGVPFELYAFKDFNADFTKITEVGAGSIDFKRVFDHARDSGMRYFFLEQDGPPDPLVNVTNGLHNLQRMLD